MDLTFSDAQGKQEGQVRALKSFVAKKVDAIILAPDIETGWDQVLQSVKQAKIPVVLVDRGVNVKDESLYTTLIASDFVAEGRRAGDPAELVADNGEILATLSWRPERDDLEGIVRDALAWERKLAEMGR